MIRPPGGRFAAEYRYGTRDGNGGLFAGRLRPGDDSDAAQRATGSSQLHDQESKDQQEHEPEQDESAANVAHILRLRRRSFGRGAGRVRHRRTGGRGGRTRVSRTRGGRTRNRRPASMSLSWCKHDPQGTHQQGESGNDRHDGDNPDAWPESGVGRHDQRAQARQQQEKPHRNAGGHKASGGGAAHRRATMHFVRSRVVGHHLAWFETALLIIRAPVTEIRCDAQLRNSNATTPMTTARNSTTATTTAARCADDASLRAYAISQTPPAETARPIIATGVTNPT